MRDTYLAAQTRTKITAQIRTLRSQRGWSQGEFAKRLGKPQSNVSRLENRDYGSFTLATLLELAAAFDVGLSVEFVRYDDFLRRTNDLSPGALNVPDFSRDALTVLCHDDGVVQNENQRAEQPDHANWRPGPLGFSDQTLDFSNNLTTYNGYLNETMQPIKALVSTSTIANYVASGVLGFGLAIGGVTPQQIAPDVRLASKEREIADLRRQLDQERKKRVQAERRLQQVLSARPNPPGTLFAQPEQAHSSDISIPWWDDPGVTAESSTFQRNLWGQPTGVRS